MSALADHKFIVIGDSYTVGITGGGATIDSWLDYFVRWYGNEWAGYYESAVGGYGFARSDNKLFIDLLNALDNEISDKAGVTDILVAGGYNDGNEYSINHMESAISTFATTARQKYVNATLWIAPIGWTTNQHQANVKRAIDSYIQYGEAYGYRVLTEMQYVMRNTAYLSSDEIHPNADGYQALARKMYACFISYLSGVKIAYNGADKWKIRATELLNQGGSGGGGGGNVDDVTVNGTSVVTNKVAVIDLTSYAETADLATVATSGDYTDLTNKPTIPAAQVNSDWNASSGVAEILNKPSLATVATSGSYNDLNNKPTIPAAQVNSDWNASSGVAEILNKPTIPTIPVVMPQSEATTGTATTQRTITAKVLNDTIEGKGYVTTDEKVKQTATSTDADYEVLFSATADNTTRTEGARKGSKLKFNPSSGNLQATQLNGVTIGSSPKFTDNNTTYTFAEGSTNGAFSVTPSGGSAQSVKVHGVITDISGKQDTITGGASSITSSNLTASRALVSNSSGKVTSSSVTSAELGYLDGVTSNVQTQLGNKLSTSGGTVTGDIYRKSSSVTIGTTSNNGVTTDISPGFVVRDSNDAYYARADGLAQTTGFVAARLVAKNKTTSGTEITNSLYAGVKKDGTRVVKLGDGNCTFTFGTNGAANLRSAINAQATLSTDVTTTGTDGFYVRRYGNVIQIQGNNVTANKRGTVPSGYRPGTSVHLPGIVQHVISSTSDEWFMGTIEVTTAGAITIHYISGTKNETTTSSAYHIWVSGTYVV